jgi:hypothetical protein
VLNVEIAFRASKRTRFPPSIKRIDPLGVLGEQRADGLAVMFSCAWSNRIVRQYWPSGRNRVLLCRPYPVCYDFNRSVMNELLQ